MPQEDHEIPASSDARTRRLFELFVDSDASDWKRVDLVDGEDAGTREALDEIMGIRSAFRRSADEAARESAEYRRNLDNALDGNSTRLPQGGLPVVPGYDTLGVLGEGGFARIYKARDVRSERLVALKLLRRRLGLRPESVARFLREARALAKLNHRSIVRIHHVIEEGDLLGLSMELISGKTLKQVLEDEARLAPMEVAAIGLDLASALVAVHAAGFVHRDIKAENVMREASGRIVLMDFGLTRSFDTDSNLTGTGILVGTPLAMAPEQYEFKEIDARTDVYALGSLLYRLATGRCHVEGTTMQEIRSKVLAGDHTPITTLAPDFPEELAATIERSMHVEPRRRQASAADLEADLRRWIDAQNRQKNPERRAASRTVVLLLVSILAALIAILTFLVFLTIRG